MTTKIIALHGRHVARGTGGFISALVARLLLWQERAAERQYLSTMADHELRDLGLSRADILQEAAKPFWRA
ncbi:MAG: DUF1127 domain-containing protein [Alphaproteobacteria bacterium]|nr:DUF1127 domain-containing protein [Alphaproteobacteria bacterium]